MRYKWIKILLIFLSLLYSVFAYAGGPDYAIKSLDEKSCLECEIFFGIDLGIGQGPNMIAVNSSKFPISSYNINNNPQFRNIFFLERKGSYVYGATLGFNIDSYVGFYFDYIDWGEQRLHGVNTTNASINTANFSGNLATISYGPGITGSWPFDEGLFKFFASFGLEFVESTLSFTSPACSASSCLNPFNPGSYALTTHDSPAISYAIGGQANIGKYFSLRLQYRALSRYNNATIANIRYKSIVLSFYGRYSL